MTAPGAFANAHRSRFLVGRRTADRQAAAPGKVSPDRGAAESGKVSPDRGAADPGRVSADCGAADPGKVDRDDGRAMIEVVFLAVLLLIPTVYILASVMRIQAATFAVAQGARDAGRVMDSAPTLAVGISRAEEIAQIALTDQRVPAAGMDLRFVSTGGDCVSGPEIIPSLRRGDVYDICVVAVVSFPGVPSVVTGSQNTVTGVFTMHVGDFRESG